MDYIFWPILVPVVTVVAAFAYAMVRAVANARVRELEVRERIAMIERGLVPPPEKDPNGFDRAMRRYERSRSVDEDWRGRRTPGRYRSAGVILMGIGLGLVLLIGVAGESPSSALGVGGFVVVMGLAFFVNSFIGQADARVGPPPATSSHHSDGPA